MPSGKVLVPFATPLVKLAAEDDPILFDNAIFAALTMPLVGTMAV